MNDSELSKLNFDFNDPELLKLNIALKDLLVNTTRENLTVPLVMQALHNGEFVDTSFKDNRGRTVALVIKKSLLGEKVQKVLADVVANPDQVGIEKYHFAGETRMVKPQPWQAMTQMATIIFEQVRDHGDTKALLTFAFLKQDEK